MIELRPITRDAANEAVRKWHSHHKPPRQSILRIGAFIDDVFVGASIIETCKAQALMSPTTFEVTRLATVGGGKAMSSGAVHALAVASRLLGASWGAMRAMGCTRLVSYTRKDEAGTCYRAAGWFPVAFVDGEKWDHGNKSDRWLPGLYEETTEIIDRVRWEIGPAASTARVKLTRPVIELPLPQAIAP